MQKKVKKQIFSKKKHLILIVSFHILSYMEGYVYLIGESGNENRYKIGSTRCKDINKRLKQLQTGNSEQLYIKEYFETTHPFKLETMLHNRFKSSNLIGEWYDLSKDDIAAFKNECKRFQFIIDSLKNNPFFQNKKAEYNF